MIIRYSSFWHCLRTPRWRVDGGIASKVKLLCIRDDLSGTSEKDVAMRCTFLKDHALNSALSRKQKKPKNFFRSWTSSGNIWKDSRDFWLPCWCLGSKVEVFKQTFFISCFPPPKLGGFIHLAGSNISIASFIDCFFQGWKWQVHFFCSSYIVEVVLRKLRYCDRLWNCYDSKGDFTLQQSGSTAKTTFAWWFAQAWWFFHQGFGMFWALWDSYCVFL